MWKMIGELIAKVRTYADDKAAASGFAMTAIDGVHIMRRFEPSEKLRALYRPVLCLVLQGAKQVIAGGKMLEFAAGQSFIVSVDMPVVGCIIQADREIPYLALSLDLDMSLMHDIVVELNDASVSQRQWEGGVFIDETDEAVIDCAFRLVRLLDRPESIPILRASIVKEMHYWLIAGRHGPSIRQLALPDSYAQRIAQAVRILRADFKESVSIDRLATAAGMSHSLFFQQFKAITSISPLQFQKQLRLIEARRLMLTDAASATQAAFNVGYESVSQFTREYTRMFGIPPKRHIASLKALAA
jgi:AraC-like DNA-binding protein